MASAGAPPPASPGEAAGSASVPEAVDPQQGQQRPTISPSLSKTASKKQKLATEPHGYLADKIATFVRAIKQLARGSRSKERGAGATAKAATSAGETAGVPERTADSGAGLTLPPPGQAPPSQPPPPAAPPDQAPPPAVARRASASPTGGFVQQLHHPHQHEPADLLHQPLSTTAKLRNAVVSTVEHALDEAAALQSSLGAATAEEMAKFKQEAHRGAAITTAGGLPLEGGEPRD